MSERWPLRPDERQRLAVVRSLGLLDTAPEERFDRITRMAARVLQVPSAAVSLIDAGRQWHKSAVGLDDGELPREESICGYAISEDMSGVLAVEDASADSRFRDLSVVAGPDGVRAYGGRVLRVGGRGVGTLCVMDHRPRRFTADELDALADLAHWAEAELRADEERQVSVELESLQRRTEMVLAGVAEGVVGVNRHGQVTFVNAAAEELLGWRAYELIGSDLHALTHSRHRDGRHYPEEECPVTQVLSGGATRRDLFGTFWRLDGSPLPVDWSSGPVMDGDAVVGAVVVFGDASARLAVERMKDDFTSVVSHELRTPLTSLKAALELLDHGAGGELPPAGASFLDIAVRNADRLARLVDDILDLEKSARGALSLTRTPLDAVELMRAAAATVEGTALARDIRVEVEPVTAEVWGDHHRLLQVLTNLLGNAMRFSPSGSTIRLAGSHDETAVHIDVVDQGVGIPADALPRVFDRFWQVDSSQRRASGGTGLGLAIAKNIVEAHGGFITVASEPGAGSTFTVHLPVRSQTMPVAVERRRRAPADDRPETTRKVPA
ncbi:sensor histidine kinase [Cellulomonas aerilata]|uniref:histidine kinase n=1 Tax=Cellulomonas aerilata TaxID=515326 RepID=A0A512DBA6_9CELL|nr:ATP-binding protein [Cellulomonas aerilata]GEO33667.1 hypothetical protein CAE01nite_13920 [Cellulomonas aerilata]